MTKKKKKSLPDIQLARLAAYLKEQKEKTGITYGEIEAATGIPDATLSRWFNGEVTDIGVIQLAQVCVAMELSFWKVMARAEITDELPADPTVEAQRIASIIADEEDAQLIMGSVLKLGPRDRRALRKYAELLGDQSDLPTAPESE